MERNEMVIQILSRVMEKLAQAGETVTGADDLQNIVQSIVAGTKEPLPGLLVLTKIRKSEKNTIPAVRCFRKTRSAWMASRQLCCLI